MADQKISELTAVTTPASTDEFACNQGGTSKKQTRAQLHTLESVEQVLLDYGSLGAPGFAFNGDPDTGFYRAAADTMGIVGGGLLAGFITSTAIRGGGAQNYSITTGAKYSNYSTTPHYSIRNDENTGVGSGAPDTLSRIVGGVEAVRHTEASSAVIQANQSDVGLTAHTDSVQGAGVILSTYNVYSTVGTIGDAATLPAVFIEGTLIYVKNDGANSMDVFPASGDDAGAGADTAVAIASGDFAVFICTAADATWTKLLGGTA